DGKHPVAPDSGQHGNGNVLFHYRGTGIAPSVGGFEFDREQPLKWDEFLRKMIANEPRADVRKKINEIQGSRDLQLLLAVKSMCEAGLRQFLMSHGTYPETWQQFLDSGFSPIDPNSINPYTHSAF